MKACTTVAFLLILGFTEAKERPNRNGERAYYSHEKSLASSSVPPPRAGGRGDSSVGLKHGTARSGGSMGVDVPPKTKEAHARHHHADVKSSGNLRARPKAEVSSRNNDRRHSSRIKPTRLDPHQKEARTQDNVLWYEGNPDSSTVVSCGACCFGKPRPLADSDFVKDGNPYKWRVEKNGFYGKVIDVGGVPVIGSNAVTDAALQEQALTLVKLVAKNPSLLDDLKADTLLAAMIGKDEKITDIPAYEYLDQIWPLDNGQTWDDRAGGGGLGATMLTRTVSCEENDTLCLSSSRYPSEMICIHELAHTVGGNTVDHSRMIPFQDGVKDFKIVLDETYYTQVVQNGLYTNSIHSSDSYATTNEAEYWATGVQAFYNVGRNGVNTRDELRNYDPLFYDMVQQVFDPDVTHSCPETDFGKCDCAATRDLCERAGVKLTDDVPSASIHIAETNSFPLGLCEGDCDSNDDCKTGLICFQRDWYESVPGCVGGSDDWSRSDYCVVPSVAETNSFPLGLCEGDCDSNGDCEPGLVCYQRDAFEGVPGCAGGSEDSSLTDYCVVPSTAETNSFPLGLCEGDCDSNDDCEPGLICFQREEFESVPGCSGGSEDSSLTDYCVKTDQVQVAAAPSLSEISSWLGDSYQHLKTVGQSVALSGDGKTFAYGLLSETTTNTVSLADTRSDLEASEIGDEFGYAISLSHDGHRMAVGIPNSSVGTVEGAGRAQVYEYDQTGDIWTQMGGDLVSSIPNEWGGRFGHSVSLNNDGDIVAVGAPSSEGVSIFRFENNEWVRMGDDIALSLYSAAAHGWSVSLSSDGLVVAVGAATNEQNWDEAGACFVYEYVSNNWQQRGQPILGQQRHGLLGTSVSLSADGNIVAIGSINYSIEESSGERAGAVFVYEYSSEGDWKSLGGDVFGDNAYDRFGRSVSLVKHENKLYLAAGAPDHDGGGHVRMYVLKVEGEDSLWDLVEDYQRNESYGGKPGGFGTSVALASSSDGLRMAVGAPWTRSDERLGLIPIQVGEVTLWQE